MSTTFWLIRIWGDVEPELLGPFSSDEARLQAALELRRKDDDQLKDGLYRLDLEAPSGVVVTPSVDCFTGSELDIEETSTDE